MESLLQEAKDYLIEHGWVKNQYVAQDGRTCIMGALALLDKGSEQLIPSIRLIEESIKENYPSYFVPGSMTVPYFNDNFRTTFNDVMDLLDEAILLEKEQSKNDDKKRKGN